MLIAYAIILLAPLWAIAIAAVVCDEIDKRETRFLAERWCRYNAPELTTTRERVAAYNRYRVETEPR